ncbi:hypothetical protein CYK37_07905 [Mesorhizobium loti]|nr:DUF930 domain-containing protein [Mesorhizobium loti]PLP60224.1 hypothetical protein CYK37_07905 [Mesorhizobium loti]
MSSEAREHDGGLLWGLAPSLILHALIIALLVYGSSRLPQQLLDDGAVNVVMVPPPKQVKPKPVPAPKEAKLEKPPEPTVEKPLEQKVEKPPAPRKSSSFPVLEPVFQFGVKDTGPKQSLDGNSAQESSASPMKNDDSKQSGAVKDSERESLATPNLPKQEEPAGNREAPQKVAEAANALKDAGAPKPDKQEVEADGADTQEAATDDAGQIKLPMAAATPQPRPARVAKPARAGAKKSGSTDVAVASSQGDPSLPGVRRLYAQGATGDPFATTSMAGVPRDQRAGKLCASVLEKQLLAASYPLELYPLIPLKAGNVLDVPDAAFRTSTAWYRLGFRCEVDTGVTRVLSFNFRVGVPIPQADWARLGLPSSY